MWKDNLIARFRHSRSGSRTPLISRGGAPPLSTATLDSAPRLPQLDGSDGQGRSYGVHGGSSRGPAPQNGPIPAASVSPKPSAALGHATRDTEASSPLGTSGIIPFFAEEIDTAQAVPPLSAYCFMTGYIDAVSFSAVFVWCAFQTGNSIQLALALARLFNGQHDTSFHTSDKQALCSVLCFLVGASVGRLGDKAGCKTRGWLVLGTFMQAFLTMCGAITIWKSGLGSVASNRGDPAWSNILSFVAIGFMSSSMGLQGIMGKRLNTQFATTVVLTSTWCELVNEPQLFNVRNFVASRDHKVIAILFLFLGAFVCRVILDRIGSAGALGVGAGLRFVVTLWWLFVPAKKAQE